jgi:Na+-translocating ferredoxin:NAD+ oxidoreductase subunit A
MTDLLLLAIGASLVNHFLLTNHPGLCPFVGVGGRYAVSVGMALATLLATMVTCMLGYAAWRWLLVPFGLDYLRAVVLVLLVAAVVLLLARWVRATSAPLYAQLGAFLPLVAANSAALGVAILELGHGRDLQDSLAHGTTAAAGFGLALVLLAALRERLVAADAPQAFRGAPLVLVTAGLMALAFMGLAALVPR